MTTKGTLREDMGDRKDFFVVSKSQQRRIELQTKEQNRFFCNYCRSKHGSPHADDCPRFVYVVQGNNGQAQSVHRSYRSAKERALPDGYGVLRYDLED
jgi:hypothetical protein